MLSLRTTNNADSCGVQLYSAKETHECILSRQVQNETQRLIHNMYRMSQYIHKPVALTIILEEKKATKD